MYEALFISKCDHISLCIRHYRLIRILKLHLIQPRLAFTRINSIAPIFVIISLENEANIYIYKIINQAIQRTTRGNSSINMYIYIFLKFYFHLY